MTSTSEKGITAFVRYLTLGEDRRDANPRLRDLIPSAYRVQFNIGRREFYSYSTHFPLARYVPAKRGRCAQWLINGDVWRGGGWTVTPAHQADTRQAIAQAIADAAARGVRVESLIIPFSALDGAGIERDSIRPLHVREDRRETFTNTANVPRDVVTRPLPTREDAERRARAIDPRGEAIHITDTLGTLALDVLTVSDTSGREDRHKLTCAKLTRAVCYLGMFYGAAPDFKREWHDYDPPQVQLWLDGSSRVTVHDNGGDTVTLVWSTERHWLGDSLFSAERVTRQRCAVCRGTGVGTGALVAPSCEHCRGRGLRDVHKRSKFLSSFDYNEPWPLYFLAALPRTSRAKTVSMATEDLAPAAVHAAYARGLAVKRQGDIFVIPTPLTDANIAARAVRRARLTMWTRNAKPRKGELGYRTPLTKRELAAYAKLVRKTALTTMRGHMAADTRPHTPHGWRAVKRRELAAIADIIAGHERRIVAGEDTCQCADNHNRSNASRPCAECERPIYYYAYTVANAVQGLERERAAYTAKLAESRPRCKGYAATGRRIHGRCYNRALNAWQDAKKTANARYCPPRDTAKFRETLAIYGTAHTATEVAVCKGGVTYVRGILRHVPGILNERRNAEHRTVALDGAVWYLAVRNTVPRQ